jgi:hypothetical protein
MIKLPYFSIRTLSLAIGFCCSADALATTYWVAKTGNDSNGCTSTTDACLTIQKGVRLLKAGDTLNVKAGTYADDGGKSAFAPAVSTCGWLDADPASANVCVNTSGTASSPIVIQAAPGDEGNVIIDAQNSRVGIHLQNSDYIQIRGFQIINARVQGIASWGQPENAVADPARLSVGVVIENNKIYNTHASWGENTSAIGMWGSKDWVVRNNLLDTVIVDGGGTLSAGIQAYGTINALIDHNKIQNVDLGIFWKDHFIQDLATRTPVFESEIRYNEVYSKNRAISAGIMGTDSEEAGENYIHHNIVYGLQNSDCGICIAMAGAYAISAKQRVENNLIDGGNAVISGISVDSSSDFRMSGNIVMRTGLDAEIITFANIGAKIPHVKYADYNLYRSTFGIIADRYGASKNFTSLGGWQAASSSTVTSLSISNPDMHSKIGTYNSIVLGADTRNYKYTSTSPALKMMADGTNAGPYQTGNEVIGLMAGWPSYSNTTTAPSPTVAPASPPTNIQIQVVN